MEPGQPEHKRPKLASGNPSFFSGPSNQPVSLPPPIQSQPAGPQQYPASCPQPPRQPYGHAPQIPFSRSSEYASSPNGHPPEDPRRHEPEYPPTMQDHRRPPVSPAIPPFASYPRDPGSVAVKSDPGEDTTMAPIRRPSSTSAGHEGLPPPPRGPMHPEDPRRTMSYDGGVGGPAMPHSPALYRPPGPSVYHPGTPTGHHQQFESPVHPYGPPPPSQGHEIYGAVAIAPSTKRKAQRASTACDHCRQLKAKCDEQKPCRNCKEKNMECKYQQQPPKQPDNISAEILKLINGMDKRFTALDQSLSTLNKSLSARDQQTSSDFVDLRNRMLRLESAMNISHGDAPDQQVYKSVEQDESFAQSGAPPPTTREENFAPGDVMGSLADQEAQGLLESEESVMEEPPGPPVEPGEPTMPAVHTTFWGLMLKWPSVQREFGQILQENIKHLDGFPWQQERQRGVLSIFGAGEGADHTPRFSRHRTEFAMTDIDDYSSECTSPASSDQHGQVAGIAPAGSEETWGGLNPDFTPDFDEKTVWRYVKSFKENILNMHPIIIPKQLDVMVAGFLSSLPRAPSRTSAPFVAQSTTSAGEISKKRKLSPAAEDHHQPGAYTRPGLPSRSIENALVLLVLALGKICLHRDAIPDVVRAEEPVVRGSPSVRNGVPTSSPSHTSPPAYTSQPQQSGLPSPREHERTLSSRRSSTQGAGGMPKMATRRNLEVIPGLDYFALATDCIGPQTSGFSLKHVYAFVFVGLYHGQLGRVLESYRWISLASNTLLTVLQPRHAALVEITQNPQAKIESLKDNQLCFAFWTCLQLESDILAELPYPQSGILAYEEKMPYPNMSLAQEHYDQRVISSYNAQLYLRKKLNLIHQLLYNTKTPEGRGFKYLELRVQHLKLQLDPSVGWVPQEYMFSDKDAPAKDILSARLRAKYWGSQVILYRPFVKMILQEEPQPSDMFSGPPPPVDQWAQCGIDVGGIEVPPGLDPRALSYARLGIEALIESTRAFHNCPQRIIVTNVFTTAHAQWGNLLTLALCFRHDVLRNYIQADTLAELFDRTIRFFKLLEQATSPLTVDLNILIGITKLAWFPHKTGLDARASSSFSSGTTTSGGPSATTHSVSHPSSNQAMLPPSLPS